CVSFTLFNLLPLPVLTGQHLLVALAPGWRDGLTRIRTYAAVVLALLVVSGMAARLIAAAPRRCGTPPAPPFPPAPSLWAPPPRTPPRRSPSIKSVALDTIVIRAAA